MQFVDIELLKAFGQIAGIGGIALGVFFLLYQDIIRKKKIPGHPPNKAYRLLRIIKIAVWSMAILGISACFWGCESPNNPATKTDNISKDSAFTKLDAKEVKARNQINGGDYSTNIIAQESSKVYVFIDKNKQRVLHTAESVVEYVRTNESNRLTQARDKFPTHETAFIEQVAVADYVFSRGQYSLSASLYREILDEMEVQQPGYNFIEGMATASFYGSARHYEGLRFICEQYAYRPAWNYRFRHAIHAHVRALVAHLGHEQAERTLDAIRRDPRCDRADFTNAWIPIHLRDMRSLEQGVPYWKWHYGINNPDDIRYAKRVLAEGGHGFADYLLFVMGQFEEVVEKYPNSYVYDLALLGIGWKSETNRAIAALEEYLSRFQKYRAEARSLLLKRVEETGEEQLASIYRARYPEQNNSSNHVPDFSMPITVPSSQVSIYNRAVKEVSLNKRDIISDYYATCPQFTAIFESGDFAKIQDALIKWRELYNQTFNIDLQMEGKLCLVDFSPYKMDAVLTIIKPGAEAQRTFDDRTLAALGRTIKLCGDARDGLQERSPECQRIQDAIMTRDNGISLHRTGANLLRKAFELSGRHDDHSLFLSGLAYRRIGDFEPFVDAMTLYVETFPQGAFADDALTELGWFYLTIRNDTATADRFFKRVVDEYPEKNAYDNALNWLVISKRMTGNYMAALKLSTKLLITVVSDRIFPKAEERHKEIRFVESLVGSSAPIKIGEDPRGYNGFAVGKTVRVFVAASENSKLPVGATLLKIQGKAISDAYHFFQTIDALQRAGTQSMEIHFRRNDNYRSKEEKITLPTHLFVSPEKI